MEEEKNKQTNKQRPRVGGKKKKWEHFLNEREKERKDGGDKEIRTNVYGGKKKTYGWKGQTCMEKKKKTYGWNETRERRNNIKA